MNFVRTRWYAVVFTIVLGSLCASALTFVHVGLAKRVEANREFDRIAAVVRVLGLATADTPREDVIDQWDRNVTVTQQGTLELFEARRDGATIGYAIELTGDGVYGPIRGALAVGPDKRTIREMIIYEQHETPGLGARIADRPFLDQFVGKDATQPLVLTSGRHDAQNVDIDAIGGASKTGFRFEQLINQRLALLASGGQQRVELDLGLDAVTKATPGYPKQYEKPPHLRPEVRRPAFLVPEGLTNLAAGKPVSASDEPVIGFLDQITDGVKTSQEGDFVEMFDDPQWVQVDLGEMRQVYAVVVWHYYKNPIIYNDVIVQLADDADFTQNVRTIFNNDIDDSSGQGAGTDTAYYSRWWGEIADSRGPAGAGTPARYARVWTNGGTGEKGTAFVEVAVYGKETE